MIGEVQKALLRRMSTGIYDRRGLSVVANYSVPVRVVKSLLAKEYIETLQFRGLVLYRRTLRGENKIYNLDKWDRR
jgi:hypothetical protein